MKVKKTAADVLVETLIRWGVDTIFGLPGDGINGIMEALRTHKDKIRFIQVRHEESAAFMACGYAKFTGKLGVCLATSGPGGIHLLNGLYDAKLDGQPVLAITGIQFHDLINTHNQQDVELDKLFIDVSVYNTRIMGPAHVENVTDLACRTALSSRGVSHICFPVDIQTMGAEAHRSVSNVPGHNTEIYFKSARLPDETSLKNAADLLNQAKKPVILVGRGAFGASAEVEKVAELLQAPIVKAMLGKAVIPDDHPYTTGGIGHVGTKASHEAMKECDCLLMVGTSFPYIEYLPKPGQAKSVQIELDPMRIGLRHPIDAGLIGDSKNCLQQLIPLLNQKTDKTFLASIQKTMNEWRDTMNIQETNPAYPMKPQVVAAELGKRLSDTAIVTCDSGTITCWWSRHIPVKRGQMHSLSGNLASMANGLPYAIAAQIAYPDREVVAFVGDGGFSMLMAEFATCVKYKLPIKIVIVKNNSLGQIRWEQMVNLGNPEYGCELEPIDFTKVAEACGGTGFFTDDPKTCGYTLDQALKNPGPTLIEAVVDPYEPPMPATVSAKDALHFVESLVRGQPDRTKIAKTIAADHAREMI